MMIKAIVSNNIIKGFKTQINSAVGVVFDQSNNILVGKSNDERNGKWCFLGGGVDQGESPLQAAIREVYEEGGTICKPLSLPMIIHPSKPTVAFLILRCEHQKPQLTKNDEFDDIKWVAIDKLPKDTLPLNIEILKMINKQ